jgi:O-antigen/teichoic acid export membrane protein
MSHSRHFLSSILRIGLSGAGAQVVVFLSLPLLSRLYSPDSFGAWALIQSAALLVGAVATCRYELAVVLPKQHGEAASVLGLGLLLAAGGAALAALVIPRIGSTLLGEATPTGLAAWSVPLLVLLSAANQLALAWCTRMAAFTLYGGAQLGLAILAGVLPALLVTTWPNATGLVVGTLIANAIVGFALWLWIGRQLLREHLVGNLAPRAMRAVAVTYRAYPLYMTPYTLLGTLRDRAVFFLLGNYSGPAEVGLYSIAQRLANAPNSLVASALRPVFFQHVLQPKAQDIPRLIEQVMLWLVVLAVPPTTFFFFFPERLLTLLFGAAWADAATYVMILALSMFPLLLGNWMDRYFDALGRQRLAFGMEFVFSILAVAVLAAALWLGAEARQAVAAQATVMAIYFTIWIVVLFRAADIELTLILRVIAMALAIAVLTAFAVWTGRSVFGLAGSCIAIALVWMPVLFGHWSRQRISG